MKIYCEICGEIDKEHHLHIDRLLLWPFFMIYDKWFNKNKLKKGESIYIHGKGD